MKNVLLVTVLGALLSPIAHAATVQFGTAGVFSGCTNVANQVAGCTANGNQISFGTDLAGNVGILLTYIGIPGSTMVNATTGASFGDIVFSCLGGGTGCASQPIPLGLMLTINVTQTLPTAGGPTGIPSASIVGAVSGVSNSGTVTWPANNTINIGVISYRIANNPLNLVPPSTSNGDTTVQGIVTDTTVPEPTTFAFIGSALIAGVALARRRRVA